MFVLIGMFVLVLLTGCSESGRDEALEAAQERFGERIELRDVQPLAEAGDAAAQFALSRMYEAGEGVEADAMQMLEWLRRSADQGYVPAQYELGSYYLRNRDKPDFVKAANWFRRAAEQGDGVAVEKKAQLVDVLTEEEFARGLRLLEEYRAMMTDDREP